VFHDAKWVIIIGMGQAAALTDVPDARFMRNMLAGLYRPCSCRHRVPGMGFVLSRRI
jgi:hypothetical protein